VRRIAGYAMGDIVGAGPVDGNASVVPDSRLRGPVPAGTAETLNLCAGATIC
jgi:hypothetical protein